MTITTVPIRYPVFSPTLPDPRELQADVQRIFLSKRLTVGAQVALLEEAVCARTGARHAIGVSSGTSGLMLLFRALDLPRGSEVIVPSFTFAATVHALLWAGLTPIFCDCEPKSFTLDPHAIEPLITRNTSAIYPVCIFGAPGDIDAYQRLAERHRLRLVFDSAQGMGSTYRGRGVGTFGVAEVFSMSPTKVVTAMEGGIVTTNDDDLAERLRCLRDYGKGPDGEDMHWLGLSARMGEVNALVGNWSLAHIDTWIANRQAIMARYRTRLRNIPGLRFQHIPLDCVASPNYMVILLDPEQAPITRDALHQRLRDDGMQTKRYFYPAVHNQTLFRHIEPGCEIRLPITEWLASSCLALPMYSHMPMHIVDEVCDRILAHALR